MTPLEVITAARQFHNAVDDDFWSDPELYNYLYFSATRLAEDSNCIENRYEQDSVASTQEYTKPTRTIKIRRIEFDGRKLDPIDFRQKDSIDFSITTTVLGTPQYYYWFDNVIGLDPIPETAGLTLKVYSYDFPSFPSDTTTLEIPTQYHESLVFGVRAMMSAKELGHPNTTFYDKKWEESVQRVIRTERTRKRADKFRTVLTEETLPNTQLGYI